jgi:Luciferase
MNDEHNTALSGRTTAIDRDRMSPLAAIEAVRGAVASWDGVTAHEHRFGGIEFRVGRRELGHLHRSFADLPFPRRIRDELITAGRAKPHHILPDSGWVTVPMRTAGEVGNVIELFRENYERAASVRR